ncbi:MAG: vWA domain-containing protein, partial [Nannocystaceae bacterium]
GEPMQMQIEVCKVIASSLKQGDKVSAVGWDTENAVKLAGYEVTGPSDPTLVGVCSGLEAGGGTDLSGGLTAGYELANLAYDPARINRVVLISDGGANVGVTDADIIGANSGSNNEDGIYLVGVGVGKTNYNDLLMDTVTDLGKGASVFIPDAQEAQKIFGDQFVNTMAVAARDVQVELSLPPGFAITKFSGEEFSTDPTEIEPQHLAPNDSMIFHQQIETCAPDLVEDETEIGVIVRYKDGVSFEERKVEKTLTFGDVEGVPSAGLLKGRAVFLYAEALKAIRDSAENIQEAHAEALEALAAAEQEAPQDGELAEIREVLEAAL